MAALHELCLWCSSTFPSRTWYLDWLTVKLDTFPRWFFFCAIAKTSRYGTVGRHRWAGHSSVEPRQRREIWTTAIFSQQNKPTEQPNHKLSSKWLSEFRISYTRISHATAYERFRLYTPATTCKKPVHERTDASYATKNGGMCRVVSQGTQEIGSVNYYNFDHLKRQETQQDQWFLNLSVQTWYYKSKSQHQDGNGNWAPATSQDTLQNSNMLNWSLGPASM